MRRTMDINAGGIRIEYLKSRRCLRLTTTDGEPVDVPLSQLIEELHIDRSDVVPPPRLLLFAGLHAQPRGGAGDLVGWFDSDDEARAAFRDARAERSDGDGWAELVALDGGSRPALRAWFGRPGSERRLRVVAGSHHHPAGRDRHLRLLAR